MPWPLQIPDELLGSEFFGTLPRREQEAGRRVEEGLLCCTGVYLCLGRQPAAQEAGLTEVPLC